MDEPKRFATVTNYEMLYGENYFAHSPGSPSFAVDAVPRLIADYCKKNSIGAVLDLGAGNGIFGSILREYGLSCIDIDVTNRNDEHFIRCDVSKNYTSEIDEIKNYCSEEIGPGYLVTCFDMAEHVDVEHIPDFIYNLSQLVQDEAVLSISTRPSSRANMFHSTIIPIDTWKYMLSLVGIECSAFEILQSHRSDQQFRSDTQELLAVSIWQKRNPFRDDASHQHYLRLTRTDASIPSRQDVRNRIEAVLDISSRSAKRDLLVGYELPSLTYLVSFLQDWSFLRSFLEVWSADRVRVIIRHDFIVPGYADVIEAYLSRVGVDFRRIETINQASQAFDAWGGGPGDLFLTATEGLQTVLHGMASLITLDARKRGMTTATLQHGDLVPDSTAHAAQFFIAMNDRSASDFENSASSSMTCTAVALGAPKHLDGAIVSADPDAIAFRLRSSARHYRQRLLVGSNMHWVAHSSPECRVMDWLSLAANSNPDILFILRPHPDDWYHLRIEFFQNHPNILMLDEMTLLCIDWPLSRVLSAVDGVVSTHSTLVLDALMAGKPTAIFPTGISHAKLLEVEREWKEMGALELSEADCSEGSLPTDWFEADPRSHGVHNKSYQDFLLGLLGLLDRKDDPAALEGAISAVESSFLKSAYDLCLDSHPHSNRMKVSSMICQLACQ
ncbi:methyltransferase domain-containing protein [Sphingorhabdus sp.]|uniref:methyltransferase domain-containing protein n=1 Tax=Sphingorhabdus sp. TaxID=1902408 RepID=UPI0040484461